MAICEKMELRRNTFSWQAMYVANAMQREIAMKFPKCPECGTRLDLFELNKKKSAVIDGYESMWFCRREASCGYSELNKGTMEDMLDKIKFDKFLLKIWKSLADMREREVLHSCKGRE